MALYDLLDAIPTACSKHDKALVLIEACIEQGTDTRKAIIAALVELGFNAQHVAILLIEHTGTNLNRHNWHRDETGRYSLLG